MGTALIRYKLMPEGIIEDFESLKKSVQEVAEKFEGKIYGEMEEQPIAFGLKALIVTISIDESKDTNLLEEGLKNIEKISSLDVIDYRRALD
jgi:elongation factor 1-beta